METVETADTVESVETEKTVWTERLKKVTHLLTTEKQEMLAHLKIIICDT